jgi:hypothetical protein
MRKSTALEFLAVALTAWGCSSADGPAEPPSPDGEHDSFGIGKADGPAGGYEACQLREVLMVVNDTTDAGFLANVAKVHSRAANNIVAHRLGADGKCGTGDDDLFDDLAELDAVPWVGQAALRALAKHVEPRCTVSLANRAYMDDQTFAGFTGGGWTRDEIEMEATMTITGVTGAKLREVLLSTDNRGRQIYSRVRRGKVMEAMSFGYALDEIPWSRSAHAAREALPYVSYSIESGRFEPDPEDGTRELSLGTDLMDDIYYDTKDFDLLAGATQYRARARWDDPKTVRRLLIAAKFDAEVDAEGIKRAGKIDVRNDSGEDDLATLDADAQSGSVAWNGTRAPIEPAKAVYDRMKERDVLTDVDGKHGVLALDPKAYLRGTRSRFHLNMTRDTDLKKVVDNGRARLAAAVEIAKARVADGTVSGGLVTQVQDFVTKANAVLDNSMLLARATPALSDVDPTLGDVVYPESFLAAGVADAKALEKRRIVAETASTVYHELADQLDDLNEHIAGADGRPHDEFVAMFRAWVVSVEPTLRVKTTPHRFYERWVVISGKTEADRAADWQAFSTYGASQKSAGNDDFDDMAPITAEIWQDLGRHLEAEMLEIDQRQIAAAGTLALTLYHELARRLWVPSSSRPSGNFIIDTMDFTDMLSHSAWSSIPVDQRTFEQPLPACKVFNTTLVNEVQIELTSISPFVKRVDELNAQIATSGSTPELEDQLGGARFVLQKMVESLGVIGQMKGDDVVDVLEDNGAGGGLAWVPAEHSKGKTALLILTDQL